MSLIGCVADCIYQHEGMCCLEHVASSGNAPSGLCVHQTARTPQDAQREVTTTHPTI